MRPAERARLDDPRWRLFGPYLAERAWGTVREDYSPDGDAWAALTHDQARSKAYRWGEDGLAGICDDQQRVCLALALWNGADPILKERLFGLTNGEGNHGEDVKERYWFEDATPTASHLRWRYHYPVAAFPYAELVEENRRRTKDDPEYELADTAAFAQGHFDVALQMAKASPDDLCWQLVATNRSAGRHPLHVLPTLWFRNTWSWADREERPHAVLDGARILAAHHSLGNLELVWDGAPEALFCDNDTNPARLYGQPTAGFAKDGIADHVVAGAATVSPAKTGTKAALWFRFDLAPGDTATVRIRLRRVGADRPIAGVGTDFDAVLDARAGEADAFHRSLLPAGAGDDDALIVRQALAGLVWSQMFYRYDVARWLVGDPGEPPPPAGRGAIRNGSWTHVDAKEIMLMPDTWEYPWFAAWDLAFQAIALAHADPASAKRQLLLLCREWLMHRNGQLPAYEWNFSDVNPPVHAFAALEVFHVTGGGDFRFLAQMFHKLLINFTWWVNQVDSRGDSLFEGGFLGMDNIGPFDRSHRPPVAGLLEQSDGTAWMAMYCLDLLQMVLSLGEDDDVYEDVALKFFEHFTVIAAAMNDQLWDEEDGFYYDVLRRPSGAAVAVRIRAISGLVVLAASRVVPAATLAALPGFAAKVEWFLAHHPSTAAVATVNDAGDLLLSVASGERLTRLAATVFASSELLSPHGLRSVSARHARQPYSATLDGVTIGPVTYEPGESRTGLFGGNSNWRGPLWMPANHLVITALRRLHGFYGASLTVPFPSEDPSARLTLGAAADALADRLLSLLRRGPPGRRPADADGSWPEGLLWFHEYFHGDTGEGLGASHQTGWTALLADLVLRRSR